RDDLVTGVQTCALPISTIDLQLVASPVTSAVYVAHAGDDSGRLFIVEQGGRIKIWDGTNLLATPFLNIANLVLFAGEQGLLSVRSEERRVGKECGCVGG